MHRLTGGAASTTLRAVLTGPDRPVEVVTRTPAAVYLRTGSAAAPALCLATGPAVRVPCAVVVAALPPELGQPEPGRPDRGRPAPGVVGTGRISLPGLTVRVGRWWRPPTPVLPADLDPAPAAAWLARHLPDPLDAAARLTLAELVDELTVPGRGDPAPLVLRLVGRGPGLTPVADDMLAGLLVTLAAAGPRATTMFAAVTDAVRVAVAPALVPAGTTGAARDRTTFVSAALLWHAALGECVPQFADLIHQLAGVSSASSATTAAGPALRTTTDRLLAVGHSSGAGLARGLRAGLAALCPAHAATGATR